MKIAAIAFTLVLFADPVRPYDKRPPVALEALASSRWTHACVVGPVVYKRRQQDGDWHITLDNGKAKVVLEIIPAIPLPVPAKGDVVKACGIVRIDKHHAWAEIHPVERIEVLRKAR